MTVSQRLRHLHTQTHVYTVQSHTNRRNALYKCVRPEQYADVENITLLYRIHSQQGDTLIKLHLFVKTLYVFFLFFFASAQIMLMIGTFTKTPGGCSVHSVWRCCGSVCEKKAKGGGAQAQRSGVNILREVSEGDQR